MGDLMNHGQGRAPQSPAMSEKVLWTCAVLAAIAALVVGPLVGGTPTSVIVPLVIAGLIAVAAFSARRQRLGAAGPAR